MGFARACGDEADGANDRREKKGKQFVPPLVSHTNPSIKGGFLKTPIAPDTDGPNAMYVKVSKKIDWWCMASTGITYGKSPLMRTKLFDKFAECLSSGADSLKVTEAVDDKMLRLRAKASKGNALAGNPERACVKNKTGKSKVATHAFEKQFRHIAVPGKSVPYTWRLYRPKKTDAVWLHVDDVPQALVYLFEEAKSKGVDMIGESESVEGGEDGSASASSSADTAKDEPTVTWDRRDYAWQGRVRGKSGEVYRITRCVPFKDKDGVVFNQTQYDLQKNAVEKIVKDWIEEYKQK